MQIIESVKMREVKFRGFCEKDSEWRYGFYITDGKTHEINTLLKCGSFYVSQIDCESLGQYTGLKDKNGTEIYEGDIIVMHTEWSGGYNSDDFGEHENKGVASIVPSKGVMLNKCLKRDLIECEDEWSKTWSVNLRSYRSVAIGNIYENPELLEK